MNEDEIYNGDFLSLVRYRIEKAQYCPDYMYAGIRHLQRNCEVECPVHPDADQDDPEEVCAQPGRYDGDLIAQALADGLKLLNMIEKLKDNADCADVIQRILEGRDE